MTPRPLIVDVTLALGDRRAEVALTVAPHVLAVAGPNGAGKTTLLRALVGARRPLRGHVRLGDRVLFDAERGVDVPTDERGIAFLPTGGGLFPHLTAEQNVAFALACRTSAVAREGRASVAKAQLAALGAEALAARRPSELSDGERQRVALARALAAQPRALLLDEPLAALDPAARPELRATLRAALARMGCPVLVVTHDAADAAALADRIAVLDEGRIVQQGLLDELRRAPASDYVRRFCG